MVSMLNGTSFEHVLVYFVSITSPLKEGNCYGSAYQPPKVRGFMELYYYIIAWQLPYKSIHSILNVSKVQNL